MKILLNGLEGTSHSVSIVHQFQLIEFARSEKHQNIYKQSINHSWPKIECGFNSNDSKLIQSINLCEKNIEYDIEYSIGAYRPDEDIKSKYKLNFFVTEFGNLDDRGQDIARRIQQGEIYIVPSFWVKKLLSELVGSDDGINVITHGYNPEYFYPIDADSVLLNRNIVGISNDEFIFMNLGALTWNKGVDLLLIAFSLLRQKYKHIKLILKDSSNLYRIRAKDLINDLLHKGMIDTDCIPYIIIVEGHLNFDKINILYGISDCYVSPYRAEGFNVPVLESLATGLHVITTNGGPTDDYCNYENTSKITSQPAQSDIGTYLIPNIDDLIHQMEYAIHSQLKKNKINCIHKLKESYTYKHVVDLLFTSFASINNI